MNDKLLHTINGWAGQNHLLDNVMIFCASYLVYFVFLAAVLFVAYGIYKRQWRLLAYFLATLIISFVLLQLVGLWHFDHRPFMDYHLTQLVAHAPGKSFPSDHTTASAAIAFGLLFFTKFKKLGWLVFFAAILIGFARIFVGIHYPADLVAGIIVGLLGAGFIFMAKLIFDKNIVEVTKHETKN